MRDAGLSPASLVVFAFSLACLLAQQHRSFRKREQRHLLDSIVRMYICIQEEKVSMVKVNVGCLLSTSVTLSFEIDKFSYY